MNEIPKYLKKYIVEQNYNQYTPIDHACWRFIMRLNRDYFCRYAHPKYLEGLDKTGITINRILKGPLGFYLYIFVLQIEP